MFALTLINAPARQTFAQTADRVSIHWHPRAACARPEALEREVARLVGPTVSRMEPLFADVNVHATKQRTFALDLRIEGLTEQTERRIELGSCAEIQRAAALIITTAVQLAGRDTAPDFSRILPATPSTSDTESASDPAADPKREAAAAQAEEKSAPPPTRIDGPAPDRARPLAWWLRLGLLTDVRVLPGMTAGPNAGVGLYLRNVHAWLDTRYMFARERTDRAGTLHAEVDMFAAAVGAARPFEQGFLTVAPLTELELGLLRAYALGERNGGSAHAALATLFAGGRITARVREHLTIGLDASLGFLLTRPRFTLVEDGLHRAPQWTARIALGLGVQLGGSQ